MLGRSPFLAALFVSLFATASIAQDNQAEITFWNSVKDAADAAELKAYVEAFPNGMFVPLARIRIDKLEKTAPPANAPNSTEAVAADPPVVDPAPADPKPAAKAAELSLEKLTVELGQKSGSPEQAILGIEITRVPIAIVEGLELANEHGAFVMDVVDGSAAQKANLRVGSIITALDSTTIERFPQVPEYVGQRKPGESIDIELIRLPARARDILWSRYRHLDKIDSAQIALSMARLFDRGVVMETDPQAAIRYWKRAHELGAKTAAVQIASALLSGTKVKKDVPQAMDWFRKAAHAGDNYAQETLGRTYLFGLNGIEKDVDAAVPWLRQAAEGGRTFSMYLYGHSLTWGHGTQANPAKGLEWARKAAKDNIAAASYHVAYVLDRGPGGLAKDPAGAARHLLDSHVGDSAQADDALTKTIREWSRATRQEIQRLLRASNVYSGRIDGNIGPASQRAIAAYKEQRKKK